MNYKDSGVDIEAGNEFVERLKKKAPYIGGFNGMIKVPVGYEEPVLVSGADGVGTKINMASISGDWSTIGIDLVAMCVNDIITCGAKPLYFLDYISTKKIDGRLDKIMDGIVKGCEIAAIDLLGGETAEHGRFANDIDLAGFCTGIVEKGEMLDGRMIKPGDQIIGFASSGLHSNGYSLINDMLWRHKIFYADYPELLTPTTIYSPMIQQLLDEVPILGMAHITGGGLVENVPRCLPKGLNANINYDSWPVPKIFSDIMLAGEIPEEEMKRVFNLGIGFCIILPPDIDIHTTIPSWVIGEVYE